MNCRFVTGSVRPCPSNDQSTFLFPACQACRREIVASELFPPAVRRARAAGGLRGVFAQQLPGGLALPGSTPRWTRIALILVSAVSGISAAYEIRGGPTTALIFCSLHFPSKPENLRTDNRVATLEAAKVQFEASWKQWKAWRGWRKLANFAAGGAIRTICDRHHGRRKRD